MPRSNHIAEVNKQKDYSPNRFRKWACKKKAVKRFHTRVTKTTMSISNSTIPHQPVLLDNLSLIVIHKIIDYLGIAFENHTKSHQSTFALLPLISSQADLLEKSPKGEDCQQTLSLTLEGVKFTKFPMSISAPEFALLPLIGHFQLHPSITTLTLASLVIPAS